MGIKLFERWSPEYALYSAFEDMNESGLEGLKKHLTSNALKNVEKIESISSKPGISTLSSALMGSSAVSTLLEKLSECEWSIKEVMKGSETSKAIVGFNYEDKLVGTIELTMINEDKIWKIDSLALPKFDKIALPQKDSDQPEEEA